MAAATSRNGSSEEESDNSKNISRKEIQEAIGKALELRALYAAVMKVNRSPQFHLTFMSSPPLSSHFPAHDYPVFTPSYEDEPSIPRYQYIQMHSQTDDENVQKETISSSRCTTAANASSRKELLPHGLLISDPHICPADDHRSITSSYTDPNITTLLSTSPAPDAVRSRRRNSLGDLKSVSSCNRCKPATISVNEGDNNTSNKHSNIIVPLTDSHASMNTQSKSKGMSLSWLFPLLKNKKNDSSMIRVEPKEGSEELEDLGPVTMETLKRELIEANQKRDGALTEVKEMKSSFVELKQKLKQLESYCEELKKALRKAVQTDSARVHYKLGSLSKRGKSVDGNEENAMPVSEEVMVEGFLQIVSEARLSVKHFCETLVGQIEETDGHLVEKLNLLLHPYKLSLNSKHSKATLYHLEAIINQSFYQDFENCVFQKNGSPKLLDPHQQRQVNFSSFVALRNLSWNEVLKKGTKYYSEEFSRFCDQKMSCIIATINWSRPWPEQLLQPFFVAAKCIWLLHLLAFSFYPSLTILRVEENRPYDGHFMDDIFMDKQRAHGPSRVKFMVMPGFYVRDKILTCKVVCRHKFAT